MNYPSQLKLEPDILDGLGIWFDSELTTHFGERTPWIAKINDLQRDYDAEPSTEEATFPFIGASTLIIPLTAIAFEAVHSRTMQKLRSMKQKISVDIYDPDAEILDEELERYLDQDIMVANRFLEEWEPAIIELEKLGTGVAEATYECVTKRGYRSNKAGNNESFEVVVRKGPVVKAVPITSFLMPFDCLDEQTARWCGQVFWLTPDQVPQMERDGFFAEGTADYLATHYTPTAVPTSPALDTTRKFEEMQKMVPSYPQRLEFYKIYTQYCVDPVDGELWKQYQLPDEDDELREICFVYHKDSRKVVSIWNNWYEDLRRPYRHGNYFPLEYRWAGIGIAKQNEQFQREVTTQHRQTIDNATLANTRMWKAKRNSTSIHEGEPIFPNKIWFVDEMDEIQPFENHEIYPSSYNNENQAVVYSQQRTGVNELTLGMPGVGTPGTATESQNRIQESGRKFDYSAGNVADFGNLLLADTLCNIVQWGPNIDRLRYSPKGPELEMFLKRPYGDFRHKIICNIQLINQNNNKSLDRQDATQLSGIVQQYYTQIMPVMQQLADPKIAESPLGEALRTIIKGANLTFAKILEAFDQRNPEKYLIQVPANVPAPQGEPNAESISGSGGAPPNISSSNVSVNAPNLSSVLPPEIAGLLGGGSSAMARSY